MAEVFKLTEKVSPYYCYSTIGIRVRIECTAKEGLSDGVFAYSPDSSGVEPDYTSTNGKFNHVCNVVDMIECPMDTPSPGKWPVWFRKNYVDLLLPNTDVAYDFVKKVEEEVQDLYDNMKRYNSLINRDEFIVDDGVIEDTTGGDTTDGDDDTTG